MFISTDVRSAYTDCSYANNRKNHSFFVVVVVVVVVNKETRRRGNRYSAQGCCYASVKLNEVLCCHRHPLPLPLRGSPIPINASSFPEKHVKRGSA